MLGAAPRSSPCMTGCHPGCRALTTRRAGDWRWRTWRRSSRRTRMRAAEPRSESCPTPLSGVPPGQVLPVRFQVRLRSIEPVVVVEVDVLRLGIDPDVEAGDGGRELPEGVVEVLRHLAEGSDELRAVALNRGLDSRVVAERTGAGGVVGAAWTELKGDEAIHGRSHVGAVGRAESFVNTVQPDRVWRRPRGVVREAESQSGDAVGGEGAEH